MIYRRFSIELELLQIYSIVEKVYETHTHCFIEGCGRDTMANWFYEYLGFFIRKNTIRSWLNDLCDIGILEKGKSKSGHTTFRATGKK